MFQEQRAADHDQRADQPDDPGDSSARAAANADQDGSTYSSRPIHSPATAAPANEVAFAAITARAAVSG